MQSKFDLQRTNETEYKKLMENYNSEISNEYSEDLNKYLSESGGYGLSCGINAIDNTIKGFHRKYSYCLYAEPGAGKSCLITTLIKNFNELHPKMGVVFFSLDTRAARSIKLFSHIKTGIADIEILEDKDKESKKSKVDEMLKCGQELSFSLNTQVIDERICSSIEDLEMHVKMQAKIREIGAVFIDYFQILLDSESQHETSDDVAKRIIHLIRENNLICILISQVNNDGTPAYFQTMKRRSDYVFELQKGGVNKNVYEDLTSRGLFPMTLKCVKGRDHGFGELIHIAHDPKSKRIVDI